MSDVRREHGGGEGGRPMLTQEDLSGAAASGLVARSRAGADVVVGRLCTANDLSDARALLYDVYVVEQGWRFGSDNPVGLRVEPLPDGRMGLTDDFDPIACHLGAFIASRLVGTVRFHFRNERGLFQTTAYRRARFLEP